MPLRSNNTRLQLSICMQSCTYYDYVYQSTILPFILTRLLIVQCMIHLLNKLLFCQRNSLHHCFTHYNASFSPVRGTPCTGHCFPTLSLLEQYLSHSSSIPLSTMLSCIVYAIYNWTLTTLLVILSSYIDNHLHSFVIAFTIYNPLVLSLSITR